MKAKWWGIILVGVFTAGVSVGRWARPEAITRPKIEPSAPEIRHKGGAVTLARVTDPPPPPLPEPAGVVARSRAFVADIQPLPEPSRIQFDLVTMKDGTQRVTAKGPALAGGQDFPIVPVKTVHKWTVGIGWNGRESEGMILKSKGIIDYGVTFAPINKPTRAGVVLLFRW